MTRDRLISKDMRYCIECGKFTFTTLTYKNIDSGKIFKVIELTEFGVETEIGINCICGRAIACYIMEGE